MENKLVPTISRRKKRVGRGYGSGKGGHTAGRGQKGQKSRSHIGILFEGVKMRKSLIKRLPLRRGKGKFKANPKPLLIKLEYLNVIPNGTKVDIASLVKYRLVRLEDAQKYGVKILGDGQIKQKLNIDLPISRAAAKKIEEAGGSISKQSQKS